MVGRKTRRRALEDSAHNWLLTILRQVSARSLPVMGERVVLIGQLGLRKMNKTQIKENGWTT